MQTLCAQNKKSRATFEQYVYSFRKPTISVQFLSLCPSCRYIRRLSSRRLGRFGKCSSRLWRNLPCWGSPHLRVALCRSRSPFRVSQNFHINKLINITLSMHCLFLIKPEGHLERLTYLGMGLLLGAALGVIIPE